MTRLRGWATRGERLNSKAPFGHWGTQTFVAGLKYDGLIAPWVIDAPMNRAIFEAYVETQLLPALQLGDIVILDNLSSHKSEAIEQAIRSKGTWMLFLPPYSPALNPIEMAFAKLKARRRQNHRRSLASHRQYLRTLLTRRMLKLLRCRRLWIQLIERCSSTYN